MYVLDRHYEIVLHYGSCGMNGSGSVLSGGCPVVKTVSAWKLNQSVLPVWSWPEMRPHETCSGVSPPVRRPKVSFLWTLRSTNQSPWLWWLLHPDPQFSFGICTLVWLFQTSFCYDHYDHSSSSLSLLQHHLSQDRDAYQCTCTTYSSKSYSKLEICSLSH